MTSPFSPPLYRQRYQFVVDYVQTNRPEKVIDLGCADCCLLRKLKFHRDCVQLLVGVDINPAVLHKTRRMLQPLMSDYLQPGNRPLTIELYQGSVMEREPCTIGFDLVTCVELIEHLELDEVETFSEVVFGYMEPGAVIITTPNSEFNPLLPGLRGFRNYDHKFEWTRAEFQDWAHRVCRQYGYSVEFTGVGEALGCWTDVGFCTQIGVFHRNGDRLNWSTGVTEHLEPSVYRLLYRVVYPSLCDNNIYQKTLVNEVLYEAQQLRQEWLLKKNMDSNNNPHQPYYPSVEAEHYGAEGGADEQLHVYQQSDTICVPLSSIWSTPRVRRLCGTLHNLRETLLDDPLMRLSADGSVLILPADEGEEDEDNEEEDKVNTVTDKAVNVEEDWDEELARLGNV